MNVNYAYISVAVLIMVLKRIVEAISEYKSIENEIRNYNRKDTVNMTPDEMNRFRHIAASALYVQKGYEEIIVNCLGQLKEIIDICKKLSFTDSSFDLKNNQIGRKIGKQFRYKNKKEMFNYIFKTEINFRRPVSKQIKF